MVTRRQFLIGGLGTIGLGSLAAACTPTAAPAPTSTPLQSGAASTGQLTPIIAASDLAVGQNQRFLFALIGPDNRPITDAHVDFAFFKVTGTGTAQLRGRAPAVYRESPGAPDRGVYVARTDFDEAGDWGLAAQIIRGGGEPAEVRASFKVNDKSRTPAIGAMVPTSHTLTGFTPAEIEKFCSARPVDEFHHVSVAEALTQGKPLVVLFASPSFCTSRTCGPSLEVLGALHASHGDQANFVHVEIYKDGHPGEKGETVAAVDEWSLPSEPWLFIVGSDGRLADKFEGSISIEEVDPSLVRVLST